MTEAILKHRVGPLDAVPRGEGRVFEVGGQRLAVFRTHDDEVHALGNHDPRTGASVLARGIVGSRGDAPFVASPLHKDPYGLRDGVCLDDPTVRTPSFEASVVDGVVEVGVRRPVPAVAEVP